MEFMQINSLFATKICQSLFSFGIVGAKEKSYQKRKAPQMGGAALHPASFWKSLTKTFSYGVTQSLCASLFVLFLIRLNALHAGGEFEAVNFAALHRAKNAITQAVVLAVEL